MEKAKIGVVGVGWVSQVFHLPILTKFPDVEVVAVCDKDRSRAAMIAERFGIQRAYTDYQQMLAAEDIQAVDICTPTDLHKEIAIASLDAGKDVFIEKPIARTYEEAVAVDEAARRSKRKVMVGMNSRFRPDTMVLRSFLEKGELGKIFYVKTGWLKKLSPTNPWITRKEKSGGGVVLDLGIVMLDLLLWMTDFPRIKRVNANIYKHKTRVVEDSCLAYIEAENGITATIEVSWSLATTDDVFYCDLFGTQGSARINPLRIMKEMHGNVVNVTPVKVETPHNLLKKSYENELRHFIGATRGLHKVISTAEEARHRMKIVDAIYKSASKGKEIVFQ